MIRNMFSIAWVSAARKSELPLSKLTKYDNVLDKLYPIIAELKLG